MLQLIKDYGSKVSWNVGSLFAHDFYVWKLVEVVEELGYENPINYVFGSIPCLFQGGRVAPRTAEYYDALKILDRYNDRGIGCRLTFSNTLIEDNELDDELSNNLMRYLNDKGKGANNGVIVTLDKLANHIRDKYPNLQVIASQVKPSSEVGLGDDKDTVDYYNKLFDLYDIVVVNPMKAIDTTFLSKIEYPERVEFIANHRCVPNCPHARFHYETQDRLGYAMLHHQDTNDICYTLEKLQEKCENTKASFPLAGCSMSYATIENLVRTGFTQFKIEGREVEGIAFVRDVGDYIFEAYLHNRIAHAILRGNV